MSSLILGLLLAVATLALALFYLWLVHRGSLENQAGLRALAALRWREFSTMVGQAMQRRGLRDVERGPPEEQRGDGGSQMLMSDGSRRWLLSCKHGMAYQIHASHIHELAAEMDLAGARSGMLLTEGRADRDAVSAAAGLNIEVVDGRRLWALLKPFMPAGTTRNISQSAAATCKRLSLIAVLASVALGALVAVVSPALFEARQAQAPARTPPQAAPGTPATAGEAQATTGPSDPAAEAPADPAAAGIEANPDEPTQARYQAEIARTLSAVPYIDRAYWLTRATLVIDLEADDALAWPLVCSELERYPSLRTVRVQLNPRPGSNEAVRWRQCRTL